MASRPRTCPECRASLKSARPPRNGKLWCPECGARIACSEDDDFNDGIRSGPGSVRRSSAAKSPRRYADDDDEPVRKKPSSSLAAPVVMVAVLGGLVLLGFVGALVAFWLLSRSPDEAGAVALAERRVVQDPPPREPIRAAPQGDAPADRAGALPLKELKAASVYIIAMTQTMYATGSGFVVRAQGDTAYVITNHHVITPPKDEAIGPRSPFIPRGPRMPIPPRPPIGPRFPRQRFQFQQPHGQQPVTELMVVFYSSEEREQSVAAEVVADNADDDLALLRVSGLREAPRPIDWQRTPELVETMTVYAFGFPFGKDLDPKKGNPAITVTKGGVSSLRQDRGELKEVQLDLDLNPGNSGGPVVDDKGALVGVAVAKVTNSRIGFAVPAHKLKRFLQGHLEAP